MLAASENGEGTVATEIKESNEADSKKAAAKKDSPEKHAVMRYDDFCRFLAIEQREDEMTQEKSINLFHGVSEERDGISLYQFCSYCSTLPQQRTPP